MFGVTLVRLAQVVIGLLCIVVGLVSRDRVAKLLVPTGVVLVVSGAFYFLGGSVSLWISIPTASVIAVTALAWWVRLIKDTPPLHPQPR